MAIIDERLAVVQPLSKFWYQKKVAAMDMLRLDLLHPIISGNKWFKLRLSMKHAVEHGLKTIVTAGGGYSNHLIATAAAAARFGLASVGIVRGQHDQLTPTLQACRAEGMQLLFVSHEVYTARDTPGWVQELAGHFDDILFIPEGGASHLGRAGAALLGRFIGPGYTHIIVSVGTGTTLTGIRNSLPVQQQVMGFAPMKGGQYLADHITPHLRPGANANWQLYDQYHFGGFGKWNNELVAFMNDFYKENHIPLDIVYTGKMMAGIHAMLMDNHFSVSDRVLCIHTGGLQGNSSVTGLVY